MVESEEQHTTAEVEKTAKTMNVEKGDAHDKAKAELLGSDHSGHASEDGKEEVFQDCLDEINFAKQFDEKAVADGKDDHTEDEQAEDKPEEENKED